MTSGSLDGELISQLYDTIEQEPPAITARELLIQLFDEAGLSSEAEGVAQELLKLDPGNVGALRITQRAANRASKRSSKPQSNQSTAPRSNKASASLTRYIALKKTSRKSQLGQDPHEERQLVELHTSLIHRSSQLLKDYELVESFGSNSLIEFPPTDEVKALKRNLKFLSKGRTDQVIWKQSPSSVKSLASSLEAEGSRGLHFIIDDFSDFARWFESTQEADSDKTREALLRRTRALQAVLPSDQEDLAAVAMMHVEHEVLQRVYANKATMILFEPIASIPRESFWVTEDGYAWDMNELAGALAAASGVMRNPLSQQMFTTHDIRAIMQHPSCHVLSSMVQEQGELRRGFRTTTVARLKDLADNLLADQSMDQKSSRLAIDEFSAYLAALPKAEQNAVDKLRVPAIDSHSRVPFDCSIGEAIRDAQANRVCLHKTGDFLQQAAAHLQHAH